MTTQATAPAPVAANLTGAERAAALIGIARSAATMPEDAITACLWAFAAPSLDPEQRTGLFGELTEAVATADGLMDGSIWWANVYDETEFCGSPDQQMAAIDLACQLVQDTA